MVNATIGSNHGHTLVVPEADVLAAADVTYDISGTSGHTHSVTIGGADFAVLAAGGSLTLESTDGSSHTHSVTVTC